MGIHALGKPMTLPATNIGFGSINAEMGRPTRQQYDFDDSEGRKLASAGLTGQSVAPRSEIRLSRFRNHSRVRYTLTADEENVSVLAKITSTGNYNPGLSYSSFTVNPSVNVTSSSTASPALSSASWVNGDIIEIFNNGYIIGKGGDGGEAGPGDTQGSPGQNGGTAISVSYDTYVTNLASGSIFGGGGGGGGGHGDHYFTGIVCTSRRPLAGGGGGGGAGFGAAPGANAGSPGTLTVGGAGGGGSFRQECGGFGWGGNGGSGGNPGQDGLIGNGANQVAGGGAPGGIAGNYISGIAYVTLVNQGTIAGNVA